MDLMILETQKWLNTTYGTDSRYKPVDETGKTGWQTIYALTRALQIELGIQNTADSFGPNTQKLFIKKWPFGIKQQNDSDKTKSNIYAIIQGALWCKGYSTGSHITKNFYNGTGKAVKSLKTDMGLGGDSTVTVDIMKALLSMQQFVLLTYNGGNYSIRSIQQEINRKYKNYTGIIPTDGLYGREMNKAMIKVLQSIEGYSPNNATGNFGSGTISKLKNITSQNAASNGIWVWIGRVMLLCNGYEIQIHTGWNSELEIFIKEFQKEYCIPETNSFDINTWMSLFVSTGNPNRKAYACDARFEITDDFANKLKIDGYKIIGRYITGGNFKELRDGELQRIINHGFSYFPIFQDNGRKFSEFTYINGLEHGRKASEAALSKGIPPTVIYFAVDMDVYDYQIDSNIIPYFKGISETIDSRYSIGIYASRNVCIKVAMAGYSVSSFVSDMSTGFSGNLGFPLPKDWNYDQFHETLGYSNNCDIDKVAYSGKFPPCNIILPREEYQVDENRFINWLRSTEKACAENFKNILSPWYGYNYVIGRAILEYLRKPTYWGTNYAGMWNLYTPEVGIDEKETGAREICQVTCDKQVKIKDTVNSIDIAHMAATALGYIHWGVATNKSNYSLGDLGGWPLDLLQIWGNYYREAKGQNLKNWLKEYLGNKEDGKGFGYDDVLADADAYLIANKGITHLSDNLSEIYKLSKSDRIKKFYAERFDSSKENVISAFTKLSDGIDFSRIKNLNTSLLLKAAKADSLPTKDESVTLAITLAEFIETSVI